MPAGKYVAETSDIRWNGAGTQLVVAVHTTEWKKKAQDTFTRHDRSALSSLQDSKDPFLAWDDLRRMGGRRSVGALDVKTGTVSRARSRDGDHELHARRRRIVVTLRRRPTKKTDYEAGGNDGKLIRARHSNGRAAHRDGVDARRAGHLGRRRKTLRLFARRTRLRRQHRRLGDAYDRRSARAAQGRLPTRPPPRQPVVAAAAGVAARMAASIATRRLASARAATRCCSRIGEGLWVYDLNTNAKDLAIATEDSNTTSPRVTLAAWSDDGSKLYFTSASRTKWERGIVRYDRATKQNRELIKDGRTYGNLRLSKDGNTVFLNVTEGNRPAELYTADGDFGNLKRFVESNPQLAAKHIGPTELMSYLDADGHSKYARRALSGRLSEGQSLSDCLHHL